MIVSFNLSFEEKEAHARTKVAHLQFEGVGVFSPGFHVRDGKLIETVTLEIQNSNIPPERVIGWIKTGKIGKQEE